MTPLINSKVNQFQWLPSGKQFGGLETGAIPGPSQAPQQLLGYNFTVIGLFGSVVFQHSRHRNNLDKWKTASSCNMQLLLKDQGFTPETPKLHFLSKPKI